MNMSEVFFKLVSAITPSKPQTMSIICGASWSFSKLITFKIVCFKFVCIGKWMNSDSIELTDPKKIKFETAAEVHLLICFRRYLCPLALLQTGIHERESEASATLHYTVVFGQIGSNKTHHITVFRNSLFAMHWWGPLELLCALKIFYAPSVQKQKGRLQLQ